MSDKQASAFQLHARVALECAVASALLAGLAHCAYVAIRVFAMHRFSWASRDIVWMAPVSYALFVVPVGLVAYALFRYVPRFVSPRAVITAPLAVAGFGVLMLVRVIHPVGLFLLALGVAFQLAGWLLSLESSMPRLIRRVGLAAAALLITATGIVRGNSWRIERRAWAAAADGLGSAPNVLFIILDTVRASSMGLYGHERANTPNLSNIAREGVRFDWAIAPASWTLPSHASMFTGLDSRAAGAGWKRSLGTSPPTVAERLADRGYVTAGFVANQHFTTWETGLTRGFHHWDDFDVSPRETFWASSLAQMTLVREVVRAQSWSERWRAVRSFDLRVQPEPEHERRSGALIVDRFLAWQTNLGARPFFAFLNLFDAHDPYVDPPGWALRYSPTPSGQETYESSIAYMDSELGRLFDELRSRGLLDKTVVIVASDHGEQFGEHDLTLHGNSLYLQSLHVPLVMRYPATIPAGRVIETAVGLDRLAATIVDLARAPELTRASASLRPLWEAAAGGEGDVPGVAVSWIEQHPWGRPNEPATIGAMTSVVDDSLHWILNGDGREELFRYREDPFERRDVADDSTLASVRATNRLASRRARLLPWRDSLAR